ncbi:MAG: hypothetical protein N3E40_00340 [Dehalococcoidia bacterium]|nr:hypothetical protein [Dehalococcoidia bacterium]
MQRLREEYPRWGKDKLVVLVRQQGFLGFGIHGGEDAAPLEGPRSPPGAHKGPRLRP